MPSIPATLPAPPGKTARGVALLLLLGLTLTACTKEQAKRRAKASGETETTETAGRTTTIASQTILSDEILWSLGEGTQGRVVAVSPLVDDPRYSTIPEQWPSAIPRLPGSSEGLLALNPGLVIIASFTAPETRAFLEAQGVKILYLEGFSGFDDLWRHTRAIAAAVDAEEAGERSIAAQKAELSELAKLSEGRPPTPAVSWGAGFVAGSGTTFDGIATYAGLTNLAAERGVEGHAALSVEAIVAWDPPVIVIGCEPPRCADAEAEFAARPGIAATRAAREGGVIGIPGAYLSSTGAGMITAARLLGERQIARDPPG